MSDQRTTHVVLRGASSRTQQTATALFPDASGTVGQGVSYTSPLGIVVTVESGLLVGRLELSRDQASLLAQYPILSQTMAVSANILARTGQLSVQGRRAGGRLCFAFSRAFYGVLSPLIPTLPVSSQALAGELKGVLLEAATLLSGQAYTAVGGDLITWTSAANVALSSIESFDPVLVGLAATVYDAADEALRGGYSYYDALSSLTPSGAMPPGSTWALWLSQLVNGIVLPNLSTLSPAS